MDKTEQDCKCLRIEGHLEDVNWIIYPRAYKQRPGYLSLGDWVADPHIWVHYVESCDGVLPDDDVLMSTDTRYWSIHDVQRYFFGDLHCEQVLFTYQYPNLRMPTELGSHFWRANTALKIPPQLYLKQLSCSVGITLQSNTKKSVKLNLQKKKDRQTLGQKMENKQQQMDRLIISDQLICLDRMDYFRRKSFLTMLRNILSSQDRLQLVSFENLCCERLEGIDLLQQLSDFNAKTVKYLFLWRFFQANQNPLLINYSYITGSGQYIRRPSTRHSFLRSLGVMSNLRLLALEYSYIADGNGGALLSLLPVIKRPHFRLQLICREDQIPGRADAALGVGGYGIPDTAWRRVTIACPDLYLLMVFFRIRDYDNLRRFLTPSIPLRETHWQLGIDLKMRQRQDSDISCFVRHISHFYGNTLVTLSIHQWRFAVFPLRRVFELMPRLVRFYYVGRVQDDVDLKRMLMIVSCGVCDKLKLIKIEIQDDEMKREYWRNVAEYLMREFADIMKLYDTKLCIKIYKN